MKTFAVIAGAFLLAVAGLQAQPRLVGPAQGQAGGKVLKVYVDVPVKAVERTRPKVRQVELPSRAEVPEEPLPPPKPENYLSQADAVELASRHADHSSRFLYLGDVPRSELAEDLAVISGQCNMLSTEADAPVPVVVPGSGGRLLRIGHADYGWSRELWEKLGEVEPYFCVRVVLPEQVVKVKRWVPWTGGRWTDGRTYPADPGWLVEVTVEQRAGNGLKVALAPWLAGQREAGSRLLALTGSQVPIVHGKWFVNWVGRQKDRNGAGYYDFLGLKKLADVDRLAGFDAKLMTAAKRKELLEAVSISGVSHQPRRIASFPTIGHMRKWQTFDSNLATEKRNSLRVLDQDNLEYDASEVFFSLPNGLWGFALANAKGELQDNVPDTVGVGPDTTSHNNDGRIHVGLSCIRCHFGHGGLNPIDGWARHQFRPPVKLQANDPALERDLRQKYLKDLEGPLADDRAVFGRALRAVTGMKAEEFGEAYKRFVAAYDPKGGIDAERAARELGATEAEFKQALLGHLKSLQRYDSLDLVLAGFLRGQSVHLAQWWEVIPKAHEILNQQRKEKDQ